MTDNDKVLVVNDTTKSGYLVRQRTRDLTTSISDDNGLVDKNYWDREYIQQKLNDIINPRHRMLLTTLWMTGVRVSEILNVRKKDIDFDNYIFDARWQKHEKVRGKWMRRPVPIHPTLRDLLRVYVAPLKDGDRVFPISRQRAYQLCKKHMGGGPHMFRHSFAVNWLRQGGDIVTLSRMLGHSQIQTTMEYLKIVPIDQGKELLKIQF